MCGGGSWGLKETGNRAKSAQGTAFPGGRGQCQAKVAREKVSTPRGPAGRSGLENGKGTFTCAGLRVAVPGLAVGSLAPGVPRSRGRAPAPSGLDAPITWGGAGGPGGPLTPDTQPWEEETANNGQGRGRDEGWPGCVGGGGSGGLQGLNSSLSPHHIHTSRAAPNTPSGQVHPVHPPLGFQGGYDWGPERSFWATARFASTLPKVFFSSSVPHPTRGPPEGAIPRHTGGLQGSSWVDSPGQDMSPGPGQSRERLRRAGPPPGTRQLREQADQGAQGVQPGTSARKKVGGCIGPCKAGVAGGNRGEVREATGAREGLVREGVVSAPAGPQTWTQVSLSELSFLLNLVCINSGSQ